jgi:UDPglucose--hexose-1-phosphate uridylyltransferase
MTQQTLQDHSHRRYNPLSGEWIQVSPHRAKRPWQGQVEKTDESQKPEYDPSCYLCPGNKRSNGLLNPAYSSTFSFTNDFSAIVEDVPDQELNDGLLKAKTEKGICRVICFSPRHDLTIPELDTDSIKKVIELWIEEYNELGKNEFINYVQIFENKGSVMGCSNPHPHGQVWAQESIPVEPLKKQQHQLAYYLAKNTTLLSDYLKQETALNERVILENDHFITVVPFWATWPFETMIIPRRPMARITDMTEVEQYAFADMYRRLTIRYDNLFETSFPYSAGIHQAPTDHNEHKEWHWHMVFYPPLLRSATIRKFMVGYELLANAQRDITPETSAARLKALPDVHYKSILVSNDQL